jgi:uncharacterized protein YqeY
MSIAQALKDRSLELRKSKHELRDFLTGVLSDAKDRAQAETKDGVKPPVSDDHAIAAIRGSIKIQNDMLAIFVEHVPSDHDMQVVLAKKALLESILPAQATAEEIEAEVRGFIDSLADKTSKGIMGQVMKHLNVKFGASLDKALASRVTQEVIKSLQA